MSGILYRRLRALLPLPQVLVGTVVEIFADDTSSVELPGSGTTIGYPGNVATGSLLRVRGSSVEVGKRAFIRAGVIESEAPAGDIIEIEVGRVVVLPPAGEVEWWLFGAAIACTAPPADGSEIDPPGTGAITITGTTGWLQRRLLDRTASGTVLANAVSVSGDAPSTTWTPTAGISAPDTSAPTITLEDATRGLWRLDVPLIASSTWSGGRLLVRGQYDLALTFVPTDGVSSPAASWQYLIP